MVNILSFVPLAYVYQCLGSIVDNSSFIVRQRIVLYELKSEEMLREGLAKYYEKDFEGAISKFNSLLLRYPESCDGWYNLGVVWQHAGNVVEAVHSYETSLRCNPSDQRARLNLATLYHLRSDINIAIEHYRFYNYMIR